MTSSKYYIAAADVQGHRYPAQYISTNLKDTYNIYAYILYRHNDPDLRTTPHKSSCCLTSEVVSYNFCSISSRVWISPSSAILLMAFSNTRHWFTLVSKSDISSRVAALSSSSFRRLENKLSNVSNDIIVNIYSYMHFKIKMLIQKNQNKTKQKNRANLRDLIAVTSLVI